MPQPLRAVLFDLDETLHDKAATVRAFAADQHRRFDLTQAQVPLTEWIGANERLNAQRITKPEVFGELARRFALQPDLAATLLADFDARLGRFAQPVDGAPELLQACRQRGWRVGLVTNGRDAFQRSKITGLGFDRWIDAIVTSGGLGVKKPDPRIFQVALSALEVAAQQAAFVGDHLLHDVMPARALGLYAIWRTGGSGPQRLDGVAPADLGPDNGPDFVSPSLHAIREHLSDLARHAG